MTIFNARLLYMNQVQILHDRLIITDVKCSVFTKYFCYKTNFNNNYYVDIITSHIKLHAITSCIHT